MGIGKEKHVYHQVLFHSAEVYAPGSGATSWSSITHHAQVFSKRGTRKI